MSEDPCETTQTLRLELPVAPTVLIVDDDALVLARLAELVTADGYSVRTAAGAAQALAALDEFSASIVVTDLNMPDMDGLQLCRRIRERASPGYVYIVLLTVRDDEKDVLAGLEAGADDYLSKRSSAALFTARLRTARRILGLEYSLRDEIDRNRQLAMSDALTGVYNRRYFIRHLSRELRRARRFGGNLSLMLLDVDHFKSINDTHGHAVGDAVLKKLVRQISLCLRRETDWCARLGGDEFAVVLEGAKLAEAQDCAELLQRAIMSAWVETPAGPVRFTVSMGLGTLEDIVNRESATVQSLLDPADAHLYASKARGRNRITSSNGTHPVAARSGASRSHHVNPKAALSTVR